MSVVDYIDKKESLLNKILENTRSQTGAIKQDDLEILETLIEQRAEMMQQVDMLDQQVAPSREQPSKRAPESIKLILRQIIDTDKANQILIKKDMKDMGEELADVKAQLRSARERKQQEAGYIPEYGIYKEEGIFFDTKE